MRRVQTIIAAAGLAALTGVVGAASQRDLGVEVLGPTDGWAALGEGVTGGAFAAPSQTYVVHNRRELIAALNNGVFSSTSPSNPSNELKIIYVDGTIDGNVDDNNVPLTCADYYRDGYTLEAYLAAYDPAGPWGPIPPSGALEAARLTSRTAQQARVRIRPGNNTTIVGIGRKATLRGVWIDLRGSSSAKRQNVIIRNLNFQDVYDCFPAWTPSATAIGSWDAEYDAISLRDTERVWIDHNDFADVETVDSTLPVYFGAKYQVHDGLVDVTNASDRVTISYNRFYDHDKTMLIGSSDGATADRGRLRVTLHHNLFGNIVQRAPRVRFGQVHVYNNYYVIPDGAAYGYSWGVGVHTTESGVVRSGIYAENNFFRTEKSVTPDQFISRVNGLAILALGTLYNSAADIHGVDPVVEYNVVRDPDLSHDVGWVPTLHEVIHPTYRVPSLIESRAGPFNW